MSVDESRPAAGVTVAYRVRFDECGPDGVARTSTLLRYAQDVAWIHSERMGFDRDWYLERGLAWVVRAAELRIMCPIALGATLDITTAVTGFRRVWARRRTEARLADGTLALWMHTDWVMIGERGLPGRVPPEFPAAFTVPPGTFEPGRVPLAPTPPGVAVTRASVRPQDLDPMGHVNNAAYLDYLEEAMIGCGAPGTASDLRDAPHGAARVPRTRLTRRPAHWRRVGGRRRRPGRLGMAAHRRRRSGARARPGRRGRIGPLGHDPQLRDRCRCTPRQQADAPMGPSRHGTWPPGT